MLSLAYVAGLFDGEGSIGVYAYERGKLRNVHFRTQMVQNETPASRLIWDEMRERWGGNISTALSSTGRRKMNWQLGHGNAVAFLREIRPHLLLKSDQVDLALEWWENHPLTEERSPDGRILRRSEEVWKAAVDVTEKLKAMKKA